jgi:phage shock protein C
MEVSKKLYRSRSNRVISGICGGLGEYLNIDPIIFRVVFVAMALAGGSGILIYLIGILVIPESPSTESVSQPGVNPNVINVGPQNWLSDRRNVIGAIIVVVGIVALLNQISAFHWLRWDYFWPALIIILGVYLIFKNRK